MIIFLLFVNTINMTNEEYELLIKKHIVENNIYKNVLIAFFSGGCIGAFGEALTRAFIKYLGCNISDAYLYTFCLFVIVGSIMTGLGFFDNILSICKCGLIVPSTGFANTMTSSAMDTRNEGFVKGIGSSIFKLTGSIILYGVIFGIIFGFIRSII